MSYDLHLIGGGMIRVTDEQGEQAKHLKATGSSDELLQLDKDLIEIGRVKHIEYVYQPATNLQDLSLPALPDNRCKGQHSIQKEIMILIRKKYPREWPKYFRDAEYKEKIRLWLRESSAKAWCDAKMGECACQADYVPSRASHAVVLDMFPGATEVEIVKDGRKDTD